MIKAVYTADMESENQHKDVSNHYVKNEVNRYTEAYLKYKATMRKFDSVKPSVKTRETMKK
jgi:hypothetical protein